MAGEIHMEILEIKGNTYCIDTGMTYIPFYKINEKEIIMMDSGWAEGEQAGIDELLEKNQFEVVSVICSHAHIDHIGNNSHLKSRYNCTIAMPEFEALICSSTINLKVYFGNHTLSDVELHLGHMVCETDIMISDNQDRINICGIKFKIMHTPGHSPAHICMITPDDVAYLGDCLISDEVMRSSKMPYAYILREDLKSKTMLYGLRCSKYVIAHKGIYANITQLITANIKFYKDRAEKVLRVIDYPMTMEEIMRAAIEKFHVPIRSIYRYAVIERMLKSNVEYLYESRMIKLDVDGGFLKYSRTVELPAEKRLAGAEGKIHFEG